MISSSTFTLDFILVVSGLPISPLEVGHPEFVGDTQWLCFQNPRVIARDAVQFRLDYSAHSYATRSKKSVCVCVFVCVCVCVERGKMDVGEL